jgi:hypothetical protein
VTLHAHDDEQLTVPHAESPVQVMLQEPAPHVTFWQALAVVHAMVQPSPVQWTSWQA